ncbi:major coat protein [Pelotalea chapellei]|uniref:Uncharacterized protein n=1 Tax=Pelotalea chapellei TaxID=44671 RepID=A0ABS5U7J1_9BACT|nr:major coat protein [Pelotalea chapellei]MBT1071623.1 hypothetical protein [Pelotalea chapellei]
MKKRILSGLAVVGSVVTAAVPSFAAATLDFTGVGTAVTAELSPAIAAAMPIAGTILAAGIAWKLYKKFTK